MKLTQLKEDMNKMKETWEEIFNANFSSDTEKIIRLAEKMRSKENNVFFLNSFIEEFYNVEVTLDIRNTNLGSYHETWGSIFATYINLLKSYEIISDLKEDEVIEITRNKDMECFINELVLNVDGEKDVLDITTMKYNVNVE